MDRVSDDLERWLESDKPRTLGSLIELFGKRSFAVLFVVLLGVPALPLPTGGATHVFEVIAMLLSLQLIVGREQIWLPQRWRRMQFEGAKQQKFTRALLKLIRWLERFSRPRLRRLLERRLATSAFGVLVLVLSIGAFVAPPFSGLDTGPALGAVVLSLGVLLEDFVVFGAGIVVGVAGVTLELALGRAAFNGAKQLFSALVL